MRQHDWADILWTFGVKTGLAKLVAVATVILVVSCGGKDLPEGCVDPSQQLCEPAHAPAFCCPDDMACGTGPIDQGGNGCAEDRCCPSPVAPDGGE